MKKTLLKWLCVMASSICLSAFAEKGLISGWSSERSGTVPLETQFAVSAALGNDQTAYHVLPMIQADTASPKGLRRASPTGEGTGYQAANPNQHFDARFDAQGASIASDGTQWDISVRAWGYDDTGLDRVEYFYCPASLLRQGSAGQTVVCRPSSVVCPLVAPCVSANRVEYRRGALTEWYVNGPLGLQQGFTVNAPPARRGLGLVPLTLVLNLPRCAARSGGHSQVDADRKGLTLLTDKNEPALRYSGLTALDADGVRLPAWLETRSHELLLRVDDTGARYPLTIDPFIQQAKLTAADGIASDYFGYFLALSSDGNTAIAGADGEDPLGAGRGAAYVFTRSGTSWSQQAKLTASDAGANDYLGSSVALSSDGNTAIAGADGANVGGKTDQGTAYVFTRSGTAWTQQEKLTVQDGTELDYFGSSVALSSDGNTAIAGAYRADVGGNGQQGVAYVFTRSGIAWTQQEKLIAQDGAAGDYFGFSVALSSDGNTAIAGAYVAVVGGKYGQGAVYVFTRSGTNWTQQEKLAASDGDWNDSFGYSVALSSDGNTAIASAIHAVVGGNADQGAAYVFTRSGTSWSQQVKLTVADGAGSDYFGRDVALSGDGNIAIAGANGADVGGNADQGAAYVFSVILSVPGALQFSASSTSVNENAGSVTLTVTRSGGSSGAASVNYATANGTASAGTDYTATNGALTWTDGNSDNQTITVPISDRSGMQGSRAFSITLSDGSGASLGSPDQAAVTIHDVGSAGTLQFSASSTSVNENVGSVTLTVTRSGGSFGAASVNYATANGTASAGTDYTAASGTLNWADGNAVSKTITVPIINRFDTQASREFTVGLSGASGASLGLSTSSTVIIDDVLTPPSAPTGVSASDGAFTDKVRVTWSTASGATGYQIFRYTSNNSASADQIGTTTSTTYDDTSAVAGTTYYYWVKSVNTMDASAFSSSDSGWRACVLSGVSADFDGDRKADPAIYDARTGAWSIKLSGSGYYELDLSDFLGGPGYIPAVADYDGDHLADPAVYQETTGNWIILQSGSGYSRLERNAFLGGLGWAPASADYEGDHNADYAVYQEATGNWKVKLASTGYAEIDLNGFLGSPGYSAVSADYDGDSLADPAVYNRTDGTWKILLSGSYYAPVVLPHFLGGTDWSAVPGDYDGDGLADPAVRKTDGSEWRIMLSGSGYTLISLPMGL